MARPIKLGLSYFPLDVDIDQDDKISVIEAIHGIEGFGVLIKLFMKIYKEGYFYNWSEREQLIFSRRVNVDINSAKQIVSDSLDEKIFDKTLYLDYGILTSAGIQKRYLEAVTRRKEVSLEKRYLLINPHEYVGKNAKIKIKILDENGLEVASEGVNVDINDNLPVINDNISTQRREEKSKEEKIIKPSTHKFEICDMENAKLLFSLIESNLPGAKKPNFDKWANEFRLLRERDNRTDKHIKWLINWSQNDIFWKANILSPATLRKQWDKLVLKAKAEHEKKQSPKTKGVDFDALRRGLEDGEERNARVNQIGNGLLP